MSLWLRLVHSQLSSHHARQLAHWLRKAATGSSATSTVASLATTYDKLARAIPAKVGAKVAWVLFASQVGAIYMSDELNHYAKKGPIATDLWFCPFSLSPGKIDDLHVDFDGHTVVSWGGLSGLKPGSWPQFAKAALKAVW